jgi:predicted RNA methylase
LLDFEILMLVLTIIIGFSIVWSTLALGISPMPSSKKAREAMLKLSENTGIGPVFELGSGWGNLLIPLAKKYPYRKIVGYELSIFPWLTTAIMVKVLDLKNVQVHRKNYLNEDLSDASVIICYLFPAGMLSIENKLKIDSEKLQYLISNNFSLPSHKPFKTIQLNDLYKSPVNMYHFKSKKN